MRACVCVWVGVCVCGGDVLFWGLTLRCMALLRCRCSYAQLELQAGKPTDAIKVYTTALTMAQGLTADEQRAAATLCRQFAAIHLDLSQPTAAMRVLVAYGSGSWDPVTLAVGAGPVPPTAVVKACRHFRSMNARWTGVDFDSRNSGLHFSFSFSLFVISLFVRGNACNEHAHALARRRCRVR